MKKIFISLILLVAVCSYATDEWQFDYETGDGNFTKKQRWQTFGLNIVPGVGSFFIMDDLTGAVVQWGLSGVGIPLLVVGLYGYTCDMGGTCDDKFTNDVIASTGLGLIGASLIYNAYRSITYDKPKKTAFGEHDGFNVAVLPDRNGKLNAFLMFNKAF